MKIPRRLRRVKFEAAARHTTSFAGLRFVFDLAVKLGVVGDLRTLTIKKRRRGIPIEDFVLGLASNFLVGDDSLTDLQVMDSAQRLVVDEAFEPLDHDVSGTKRRKHAESNSTAGRGTYSSAAPIPGH